MKTDSLKVAIESKLVIRTNELIAENIRLKKANEYLISQKEKLQAIFDYYSKWKPVSEKPDNAGMYFVECVPYTGHKSTIISVAYFDGDRFPWNDVVKWLPILPTNQE